MAARRILVVHEHAAPIGGVERYLATITPELVAAGHEVETWTEYPPHRSGSSAPPDVVFLHHAGAARRAHVFGLGTRVVQMVHDYRGQCISGTKLWMAPTARPCSRPLGVGCLAHYFPHRCGGLSPVTMLRDYAEQRDAAATLHRADQILTLSEHMRRSLLTQGVAADRVQTLPPVVMPPSPARPSAPPPYRLLFVGRHVREKGGDLLLDALPLIANGLAAPLAVTFAGDGPYRARWERTAQAARAGGVSVTFAGLVPAEQMDALYATHHLLIMPSRWPEPFGLTGLEAARCGVPAVAPAVGGIPEWLEDERSGILVRGRLTASTLADAVRRALDPVRWPLLAGGALAAASRHPLALHMAALQAALG